MHITHVIHIRPIALAMPTCNITNACVLQRLHVAASAVSLSHVSITSMLALRASEFSFIYNVCVGRPADTCELVIILLILSTDADNGRDCVRAIRQSGLPTEKTMKINENGLI